MNPLSSLQIISANTRGDRRELDFYPTPPEATIALMEFLNLHRDSRVLEPACGNGAIFECIE